MPARKTIYQKCLMLMIGVCLPLAALYGCASGSASNSASNNAVRICDESGCREGAAPKTMDAELKAPPAPLSPDMQKLEQLAQHNDKAAFDLALRYFRGDGVTRDSYKALQLMRSAGDKGHLDAQKALGRLYLSGLEEMGADPAEAEKWLSIAAGRGDKESAKLLTEASRAKQEVQANYQWRKQWLEYTRYYWYAYPYLGYWRNGYWYW